MFLSQDPRRERLHGVGVQHRNRRLQNDRTRVQFFVHEMHRAAGDLDAVFERLMLRVETRKGRQQRWVNIENPIRILPG